MQAANAIQDPHKLIAELFGTFMQQPNAKPATFDPSNSFAELFANAKDRILIPSFNDIAPEHIPKNSLVRFRCMIQDTLPQEMFVSAIEQRDAETGATVIRCHRYTDEPIHALSDDHDATSLDPQHLADRHTFYCISPPGETRWAKREYHVGGTLDETEAMNRLDIQDRPTTHSNGIQEKYPIPGQSHTAAIVKVCHGPDTLGPGKCVEFIGILDQNRPAAADSSDDEFASSLPGLANVPVLHAITFRVLNDMEGSPFTKETLDSVVHQARDIREQLIGYIATAFGGDLVVAEFVLLQLLSRTYKARERSDGNFALKVTNFFGRTAETVQLPSSEPASLQLNNPASQTVLAVLESLVPHLVSVPLSLDVMNKVSFCPKSIDENLKAGLLQLGRGTTLLVDDTVLTDGKLGDTGVRNVAALTHVIQYQTLTYIFPYSQFEFDVDLGVLILSSSKSKQPTGKDELLPAPWTVRLEPTYTPEEADAGNQSLPEHATLDLYRKYLQAARYTSYSIPDDTLDYVAQSFVTQRKTATEKGTTMLTEEGFRLRLQLARLVALSFGESELTKDTYDYATRLDEARQARFAAPSTAAHK